MMEELIETIPPKLNQYEKDPKFNCYSTPSQSQKSKISCKRVVKAFEKSE